MAKNVNSLQLLRNGTLFTSKAAAIEALTTGTTQDGVIKLARYTQAGDDVYSGDTGEGHIKTIFAFRHEMSAESGWTVYEDYKEVIDVIKAKIDSMTGEGSGSIYDQIMQEINKLDYSGITTGDSVVVTNVTEENGKVAATAANVGGLKLTDYTQGTASGDVAATDSINEAIAKLQNQIKAKDAEADAAIAALDYTDTAVAGEYVSQVTETDGVISVTRVALPDLAEVHEAGKPIIAVSEEKGQVAASAGTISAQYVDVADADNNFTASTVEAVLAEIKSGYTAADTALKSEILGGASTSADTLGELEQLINNVSNAAKSYSIEAVTGSELTNLGANVNEAYKLVDEGGAKSGEYIKIYKDQTLKSAEYSGQSLVLTYILADGSESAVSIDMHDLIEQTEFASGVTWDATASKVRGVVDPNSESFLTVGADGFKLTGVSGLVNNQIEALDAEESGATAHVSVKVTEEDGVITDVTVAETDIASKSDLDALSAKTVTGIDMTGGTANIANNTDGTKKITIDTDGSKILATGYNKGTDSSAIAATDSINEALAKLENQVAKAQAAATTVVQEGADNEHLSISSSTDSNTNATTYTITLTDVASDSALTAEIAARKAVDGVNGDAYTADTNANYINSASSLYGADQALDAALKTVADSANSAQTEIDAIEAAVGLNANGGHITSTGNYTSAATTIEEEIVALDTQVKTNTDNIAELSGKTITGITMNGTGVTVTNNVAAMTATYTNTAANSTDGMVITTGNDGGLTFQFGTLDCGEYT